MNASAAADSANNSSFVDSFHGIIHSTAPHSSAALDALSFATVVIAAAAAGMFQIMTKRRWPREQWVRVGFAAAPLPVYVFLPFLPWDKDMADMFADERLLLTLAAASGLMWTVREITSLFSDERSSPSEKTPAVTPLD